jgi:hypothetical protein
MKRRLRVCSSCNSHVPVALPTDAACPFCGAVSNSESAVGTPLRDVVLSKGKSGMMIAALGLTMACGEADPKPDDNNTTSPNIENTTDSGFENPNITADYAGGPINIETGPNLGPGENIEPGPDAGMTDAGDTDMG